jgi:uncharacterized membrane protein
MTATRAAWTVTTLLSLLVVLVASRYLAFDPSTYFPEQRAVYVDRQVVLGLHIAGGMVALLVGPLQLARRLRTRHVRVHRALGVVYVSVVLVAAAAGLVLATTAHGGPVAGLGFAGLAVAWVSTTALAVQAVLRRRFQEHRRWMIRSFSLTFAAVTLRLYLGLVGVLGLDYDTSYVVIAWLSWVPNLALAVWLTGERRAVTPPRVSPPVAGGSRR